jgi:hypothetical protein
VTLTTPPNGAVYSYGQVVDAEYSCTPAAAATLKSCTGTVGNGVPINTTGATSNTFSVTAEDTDGQKETVTHTYTVAAAAPKATISAPASGGIYTVGEVVSTKFSCAEGGLGSGLESCDDSNGTNTVSGGSGTLETSTLGPHTYTVSAKSKDGQAATAKISYTVAAPPTATIEAPAGGGVYFKGEVITTKFSCAEGEDGPGLASCEDSNKVSGGSGDLNTSEVGEHEYTVTATSKDGQSATARIKYVVGLPCKSAVGYGQYIAPHETSQLLQVWANLTTNLSKPQELRVNGQDGKARFALTSLTSARCIILGSTSTFSGEGRAIEPAEGHKLGWKVRFAITISSLNTSFIGTLRTEEGAIIHEVNSPFLYSTMKIS